MKKKRAKKKEMDNPAETPPERQREGPESDRVGAAVPSSSLNGREEEDDDHWLSFLSEE